MLIKVSRVHSDKTPIILGDSHLVWWYDLM